MSNNSSDKFVNLTDNFRVLRYEHLPAMVELPTIVLSISNLRCAYTYTQPPPGNAITDTLSVMMLIKGRICSSLPTDWCWEVEGGCGHCPFAHRPSLDDLMKEEPTQTVVYTFYKDLFRKMVRDGKLSVTE